MATITWESYVGAPAWTDIAANTMVFAGTGGLATAITAGVWQDESHLGNGDPGTDQCGSNHVPNVKYISGTEFDSGGGTETLNDTNLIITECTLRVHLNNASSVASSSGRFYCYDGTTTTTEAVEMDVFGFERGEGNTAWVEINNDSTNVGGDNAGERITLGDKSAGVDLYWYMALSSSPESAGAKTNFDLGFTTIIS